MLHGGAGLAIGSWLPDVTFRAHMFRASVTAMRGAGQRSHSGNARIKGQVTGRINRRAVNTLIDAEQALRHAS